MQALAAESFGLRRKIPLLFWREKSLKQFVSIHLFLNKLLNRRAQRLFKSFLARNELVASAFA